MNGEGAKSPSHLIGALTYLGFFVTAVVFMYLEPYDKDEYVRFHARQALAFSIAWVAVIIVFGVFSAVLPPLAAVLRPLQTLVNLGFAVLWVFLMYKAYTGEKFRLPILADWVDAMGF